MPICIDIVLLYIKILIKTINTTIYGIINNINDRTNVDAMIDTSDSVISGTPLNNVGIYLLITYDVLYVEL